MDISHYMKWLGGFLQPLMVDWEGTEGGGWREELLCFSAVMWHLLVSVLSDWLPTLYFHCTVYTPVNQTNQIIFFHFVHKFGNLPQMVMNAIKKKKHAKRRQAWGQRTALHSFMWHFFFSCLMLKQPKATVVLSDFLFPVSCCRGRRVLPEGFDSQLCRGVDHREGRPDHRPAAKRDWSHHQTVQIQRLLSR